MTDEDMPLEIDFRDGVRGLHHIPPGAKVKLPPSDARKNPIEPPMNADERR
jgi:hypothetical protein